MVHFIKKQLKSLGFAHGKHSANCLIHPQNHGYQRNGLIGQKFIKLHRSVKFQSLSGTKTKMISDQKL